jgi:hypothetical protein
MQFYHKSASTVSAIESELIRRRTDGAKTWDFVNRFRKKKYILEALNYIRSIWKLV